MQEKDLEVMITGSICKRKVCAELKGSLQQWLYVQGEVQQQYIQKGVLKIIPLTAKRTFYLLYNFEDVQWKPEAQHYYTAQWSPAHLHTSVLSPPVD